MKELATAFRSASPAEAQMQVQVARLSVLYEDLRVEYAGAEQDTLLPLDHTSANTRRFYFVRRTLGTLTEIEGALHKLNGNAAFKLVRARMTTAEDAAWDKAVKFFSRQHEFLKNWRNDVGGHFLDDAAEYAVQNIHPSTVGTIELYRRGNGADVKMKFAYEFVAVAMTRNRASKSEQEFLEEAFTFLADAVGNAITAIQVLTNCYLFDRFK